MRSGPSMAQNGHVRTRSLSTPGDKQKHSLKSLATCPLNVTTDSPLSARWMMSALDRAKTKGWRKKTLPNHASENSWMFPFFHAVS